MQADTDLSDEQSRLIAVAIRQELAVRRISRQRLADEARISLSTLEKALAGSRPFSLATTLRLEQALGRSLRDAPPTRSMPPPPGLAPASLGAYARAAVAWLEGDYLTLRPSFEDAGVVYAYRTEIIWDEAASALAFRESARLDAHFSQKGQVSLPHQSGHVYLVTNEQGQFRLAMLNRPTITGELYGLLTTLLAGQGAQLTPAAAPIALVPMGRVAEPAFGKVAPGAHAYDDYRGRLDRILASGFARFLT